MKKSAYAGIGAVFILAATILQRLDGGGPDLVLLIVLGLVLLIASAEVPNRKVRDGPCLAHSGRASPRRGQSDASAMQFDAIHKE